MANSANNKFPKIGLGTYKIAGDTGVIIIKQAIQLGYRMFDTAFVYENEHIIGQAIREAISEGTVSREELTVISKLGPCHHHPDRVEQGCRLSLLRLGLDYIDLYLLHTPVALKYRSDDELKPLDSDGKVELDDELSPLDTWLALEKCVQKGLVRMIGVSNFNRSQLEQILNGGNIRPTVNQVECSLKFHQKELRDYCSNEGIKCMAFTPLGKPKANEMENSFLNLDELQVIAKKYGKTSAQIALRYLVDLNVIPIPKSTNEARLKQNLEALNFELQKEDMHKLDHLVEQKRLMTLNWLTHSKHYPF
ncbi:1,5-anhydro-D-fructose reductase-like [Uranotaenia lowii]|uniref:1,5-anhydro-D-fructose reductase-like n=1 Tax=Uranotaenia lowii TaxID=190385 RepID=UPI002478E480|nr:1,5-anhydro-D-fructose reductase-like [Uranotaenia lowii]